VIPMGFYPYWGIARPARRADAAQAVTKKLHQTMISKGRFQTVLDQIRSEWRVVVLMSGRTNRAQMGGCGIGIRPKTALE